MHLDDDGELLCGFPAARECPEVGDPEITLSGSSSDGILIRMSCFANRCLVSKSSRPSVAIWRLTPKMIAL